MPSEPERPVRLSAERKSVTGDLNEIQQDLKSAQPSSVLGPSEGAQRETGLLGTEPDNVFPWG